MINGILVVNKERGITSYDVIRRLKPLLPRRYKIGHAGTLDPFADGVLIILIGKATKLMNEFLTYRKSYVVDAKLGIETDTQDITGEVVGEVDVVPSRDDINFALNKFTGSISQTPPIYSAKKVNGRKAYEIARAGESVELKPKDVEIYSIELVKLDESSFTLDVTVSSGTYIRTLVLDIAKAAGSLATAENLTRSAVGEYTLAQSVESSKLVGLSFEQLEDLIIQV